MKKLLTCIPFFILMNAISQNKNLLLKISPLCLIDDVSFPTIQAGIELRPLKRIGFYNEFGIRYRRGYYENTDTNFYVPRGFKAKTEIRYYYETFRRQPKKDSEEYYVAINAFYTRDYHNRAILYLYQKDTSAFRTDNFGVKKTVFGLNALIGGHLFIGQKFFFDYYGGLGVRYRKINPFNKEFDFNRDLLDLPHDVTVQGLISEVESKAGNATLLNFTLGARFCYRL